MILETRAVPPFYKNGFLVGCEDTREGIVIDPGDEVQELLDLVERHNLSIKYILLTHAHLDHITGVGRAKAALAAPVWLHRDDNFLYERIVQQGLAFGFPVEKQPDVDSFYDGEGPLRFGHYEVTVRHTPGHCPGGVRLFADPDGGSTVPVKDVKDLVAQLKAKPDQVHLRSAGNGTAPHYAAELFKLNAGVVMTVRRTRARRRRSATRSAGRRSSCSPSLFTALPHVKSGKLRAWQWPDRSARACLPDVPTLKEAGVDGVDVQQWYGLLRTRQDTEADHRPDQQGAEPGARRQGDRQAHGGARCGCRDEHAASRFGALVKSELDEVEERGPARETDRRMTALQPPRRPHKHTTLPRQRAASLLAMLTRCAAAPSRRRRSRSPGSPMPRPGNVEQHRRQLGEVAGQRQ